MENEKKPAAARCTVTMSLSFVLCGFFLLPLWKRIRRFLVGVSCNKKVGLDKLCFFLFHWNCSFFSKSHHFLFFLYVIIIILVHASAVIVKHGHVPTEGPINRTFFTVGQQTSRKRAWCLTYVLFFESTNFRKPQKGLSSINLLMTNVSDKSRRCLSPSLFNKLLAQWRKEVEN